MSRRNSAIPDSSNLLLDTLCNTFGSLIFIAMMLVAMNSQVVHETRTGAQTAQDELLGRQIQRADERIAELTATAGAGETKAAKTDGADSARFGALEQTLQKLQAELAGSQSQLDKTANAAVSAGNQDPHAEELRIQKIQAELELLRKEKTSLAQTLARLETKKLELNRNLQDAKKPKVTKYRLPRENNTSGKQHLYVFVRHGKIYPMYLFENGARKLNTASVHWLDQDFSKSPRPRSQLGWKLESAADSEWREYLKALSPKEYYIAFLAWGDSFTTLKKAKVMATDAGWDVGWEPWPEDSEISFGESGTGPPPPL